MLWIKTISKGVFGLLSGVAGAAVANPDAIVTLAGQKNALIVGAVVALVNSFVNFLKHKDD